MLALALGQIRGQGDNADPDLGSPNESCSPSGDGIGMGGEVGI